MREVGVIITILLATVMVTVFNIDYIFYLQSVVFLVAPIAFFITYRVAKEG